MDTRKNRRRFLTAVGKGATMAGAVLGGLMPELGARAAAPAGTGTGAPVSPGSPPPGTVTPLDPTTQATFYSQALNDADVLSLLATLGEPGRLDPPTQSFDSILDNNGESKQVFLPVTSYASGLTIAYVIYGTSSGMTYGGTPVPVTVKTLMSNTGRATFAINGALQDASTIDPMPTLYICLFPDEYAAQRGATLEVAYAERGPLARFMRKVMMAKDNDTNRGDCYRQAERSYATCLRNANGAFNAALGALGIAALCIAYALIVVGTGGAAAWTWAYFCAAAVGTAAGVVIAYKQDIAACDTLFNGNLQLCRRKFPIAT
jgi:hypothetical protein